MMRRKILIVDDEPGVVDWLVEELEAEGFQAQGVTSSRDALALVEARSFDLVISDVEMPELRGMDLLRAVHAARPDQMVVLITAFGSINLAVEAVRSGAADFLAKPFRIEALLLVIERVWRERSLRHEIVRLREEVAQRHVGDLIAESPQMRRVVDLARRAAPSDLPVLITGESGSGKSALARLIHDQSARRAQPFVQINCATLPLSLAEAELFGVRRGAFTDAREDRPGVFQQAHGGTLFLDEVGELPLELQPKLLHALELGKVRPVGASQDIPVDVRIITATNRVFEDALRERTFRADLYHRLNVIPIHVPPLRERPEDITPLVDQVFVRISRRVGRAPLGISAEAMRWLRQHPWPGNARELINAVERAVALSEHDVLVIEDFETPGQRASAGMIEDALAQEWSLEQLERLYIRRVLAHTQGNKAHAARILGLDRRTLYRKAAELEEE
jgi:DNA-binding NtrC family response regulator